MEDLSKHVKSLTTKQLKFLHRLKNYIVNTVEDRPAGYTLVKRDEHTHEVIHKVYRDKKGMLLIINECIYRESYGSNSRVLLQSIRYMIMNNKHPFQDFNKRENE